MDFDFYRQSRPRIKTGRIFFYLATLGVLILIYAKISDFYLAKDLFLNFSIFWMVAALLTQVVHYYFVALNYKVVLEMKGTEVPFKQLFPVTFVIQFLNQVLPAAGLSGQAFFVRYLKKFNLSIAEGMARAILELATVYISFSIFFIVAGLMILEDGRPALVGEFTYFLYGFLLFITFFLSIFFAFQKKKRGRATKWIVGKLHRYFENHRRKEDDEEMRQNHAGDLGNILDEVRRTLNFNGLRRMSGLFWLATFWQIVILFSDVMALYFISIGINRPLDFSVAFIVFILTKFISLVSFIPGAIGIFEAGMVLILLSFKIPAETALALTLLLRIFTFWLPMPVGWAIYNHYTKKEEMEN